MNGPDGSQGNILAVTLNDGSLHPARVLADVHAKRRILDLRESWVLQAQKAPADFRHVFEAQVSAVDVVLLSLASAWSDHPDYDPEWSPLRDPPATSD